MELPAIKLCSRSGRVGYFLSIMGYPGIIAFGCSLGATHAANLFFRFPDQFDGLLALSGIYTADYGWQAAKSSLRLKCLSMTRSAATSSATKAS